MSDWKIHDMPLVVTERPDQEPWNYEYNVAGRHGTTRNRALIFKTFLSNGAPDKHAVVSDSFANEAELEHTLWAMESYDEQ